jgi:uncharacterized membrane protein
MSDGSSSEGRVKVNFGLSMLGGILLSIVLIYETFHILSTLGVSSIFQELNLSSPIKDVISLYLFLGFSSATLALLGAYLIRKGLPRMSLVSNAVGAVVALSTLVVPSAYGFTMSTVVTGGTIISALMVGASAAMYAIAILLVAIPSPTGGYTHLGDIVVFMAALLFGHKVGGLVGVLGAVVADLYTGYSRWFVSILAHGVEGVVAGLAKGRSLAFQVVMCVAGGVLMASTYFLINIFIKGLPLAVVSYARDLFAQAGVSIIVGISITHIVKRILPHFR